MWYRLSKTTGYEKTNPSYESKMIAYLATEELRDLLAKQLNYNPSPKELESLQHEIASLGKRQAELEDVELEIMQNLENAQNAAAQLQSDDTETTQKLSNAIQARNDVFADIDFEIKSLTTQRTEISGSLPVDLIAMYDKIRSDHGGIGAAMIQRRTCQGCNLTIDAQELDKIRGLPPEVIVRCDECRRILVRTVESGL